MLSVQQVLKDQGVSVPMTKLCGWFGVARRTTYYKSTRSPAKAKPELAEPIKEMIEAEPSFGYRTVGALLGMNRNTVQRILQLKILQARKRAFGQRARIEVRVSCVERPDPDFLQGKQWTPLENCEAIDPKAYVSLVPSVREENARCSHPLTPISPRSELKRYPTARRTQRLQAFPAQSNSLKVLDVPTAHWSS